MTNQEKNQSRRSKSDLFFEFQRQKSDFESEVGFLRSNFGYFLKFSEILERTRKYFLKLAGDGGVADDW